MSPTSPTTGDRAGHVTGNRLPGLDAEYRQIREECGLFLPADRHWLEVSGPGAASFLHSQMSNEMEGLETGSGCLALVLNRKGRIQAEVRVLRTGAERFLVETTADQLPRLEAHLDRYRIGHDVGIGPLDLVTACLLGPGSAEVTGTARGPEHSFTTIALAGTEPVAVVTAAGLDLVCRPDELPAIRAELERRHVVEVSAAAVEIVRVEAGIPRIGTDTAETTLPAEAGLIERAVTFGNGCYIGQEPLVRMAHRGHANRHLRGLRFAGPAAAGDELRLGDRDLGTVGTVVLSPARGRIGLAILRREAGPGDTVTVTGPDRETTAEVVELPFTEGAP